MDKVLKKVELSDMHKDCLRDFLKVEASAYSGEMKMPVYQWQDLQEHCKREAQKIVDFHHNKLNDDLKSWVAYYKILERICKFKLRKVVQ